MSYVGDMVITGMGAVTPLGENLDSTWRALIDGVSSVKKEPEGYLAARLGANYPDGNFYQRHSQVLRNAVNEALDMAAIPCSAKGLFILCQSKPGAEIFSDFFRNLYGAAGCDVASDFKFEKKIIKNIVGACSGGIQAIFSGLAALGDSSCEDNEDKSGLRPDFAVVAIAETSIYPIYIAGFSRMGVLARRKMMPFDKKREGFAIGEGAAAIVIEKKSSISPSRRPKILAEINGIYAGASSNVIDIGEDRGAIAEAIRFCCEVRDGSSYLDEVDFVHSHGTATASNDAAEVAAIMGVFGKERCRALNVSSTKAATGHLLGASGLLGVIFSVCAIRHKKIPPTLNLDEPITDSLDFTIGKSKDKEVRRAIALAYGFGSQTGAVVVGKTR